MASLTAAGGLGVDRILHDPVADHQIARPVRRVAQHDDLVAQKLDAGRGAGDTRIARPVPADYLLGRVLDLAQRQRDAERRGAARDSHRMIGVLGRGLRAAPRGLLDSLLGEQRALDLHEMNVGGRGDAGVLHGEANGSRRFLDLCSAADLFGPEGTRQADADRQSRGGRRRHPLLAAEHQEMRRQPAFGATRHHDRDPLLDLGERAADPLGQQQLQREGGVTPGEVVDAAVALGLAHDGDDRRGIDLAPVDRRGERRGVVRAGGGEPQHASAAGHLRPPCRRRCRAARDGGAG